MAPREGTRAGYVYKDGSYNTPAVRYELAAPLTQQRVQEIIDASGLFGLTVTDTHLDRPPLGGPG